MAGIAITRKDLAAGALRMAAGRTKTARSARSARSARRMPAIALVPDRGGPGHCGADLRDGPPDAVASRTRKPSPGGC